MTIDGSKTAVNRFIQNLQREQIVSNEEPLGLPTMTFASTDSGEAHMGGDEWPSRRATPNYAGRATPMKNSGGETPLGLPEMTFDDE